ncbi:DUF222 domain-containing protein [Microbacterium sp. NPDC091313]
MTGTSTFVDSVDDDVALTAIVDALVNLADARAALDAQEAEHLAEAMRIADRRAATQSLAARMREMEERSIAAEIALATRVNDRAIQNRMHHCLDLVEDYPATLDALADGRISARHATVIVETGRPLIDPDTRARYERIVLERAMTDTAPRTRAFAARVVEDLHPRSITERHTDAAQTRRVWVDDLGDGLAQLGVIASAPLVHGVMDRLTRQAKAITAAAVPAPADRDGPDDAVHDVRTRDQVRADLATDLLLTGAPTLDPTRGTLPGGLGAIRAIVSVTVPATTAAGIHDRGATIDGATPVDADTARTLMATAPGWDRILTHPITGTVLAVDRYRPGPLLNRFLAARDIHCRFPGCRTPARRCDRDHNQEWAHGGTTQACNLACLCKRHHTLKTEKPWTPTQLPDGSIRWTSPLGRYATDPPERYVMFREDSDPPPAATPPF